MVPIPPMALAGGWWVFVIFCVLFFLAVAYGFYSHSRRTKIIHQHPEGGERRGHPGVGKGESRISDTDDPEHRRRPPMTHGTK